MPTGIVPLPKSEIRNPKPEMISISDFGFRISDFSDTLPRRGGRMDAMTPRATLVHDWLTGMRGGEKCLEPLCQRWPNATLFTLLHRPGSVSDAIEALGPRSSFLNYLPGVHRYYRYLLPIMPFAAATWRVPPSDIVVSFSHCIAKNVRVPRGVPH